MRHAAKESLLIFHGPMKGSYIVVEGKNLSGMCAHVSVVHHILDNYEPVSIVASCEKDDARSIV